MQSNSPSSTSSHAYTTHSSPWDVDGLEVMITTTSRSDTFCLIESPRDVLHIQGCSDQEISDHESLHADRDTLSSNTTSLGLKHCHHCHRCHIEGVHYTQQYLIWFAWIRNVLLIIIPPLIIILLVSFNRTYLFMILLDGVVAFGGLELMWWHYRSRERLLAPFKNQDISDPVDQEQSCVGAMIASKLGKGTKYSIAFIVAAVVSSITAIICITCYSYFIVDSHNSLGWIVLTISATISIFTTLFSAFFAPTFKDAFVLLVYGSCYMVSSLNSFLAQHEHDVKDPELLDSLYVLMVGACVIIVWRIVSSREVLESMIIVMMDMFGLLYLVAPCMSMSDFLGNPLVMVHDHLVVLFFLVVAAAEGGSRLHRALQHAYPKLSFSHCHRPSESFDAENFVVAFATAGIVAFVTEIIWKGPINSVTSGTIMVSVVAFSQYCRVPLVTMMDLAKASDIDHEKRLWIAGIMETVNPYLLATIVFHPYAKSFITAGHSY